MAIIKAINSRASIGKIINYITKDEKTKQKLITGINCIPENAIDEMKAIKIQWKKEAGRQYKHYIQSFNPTDKITSEMAHEIGLKWIDQKRFKGFQVVMATHIDRNHIHNHFVLNSVSFENGKKFTESKSDLQALKDYSNQLSQANGLTVPKKSEDVFTSFDMKKYQTINEKAIKGNIKSYVLEIGKAVNECMRLAINKDDFILEMNAKGYRVNWKDNCKHVTFQDKENHRVRLANLQKTFKDNNFTKEMLEHEFRNNFECKKRGTETGSIIEGDVGRAISCNGLGKKLRDSERIRNTIRAYTTEYGTNDGDYESFYERIRGEQNNRIGGVDKMAAGNDKANERIFELSGDISKVDLEWLQRELDERERSYER